MSNYPDRVTTLRDILNMSPEQRKAEYRVNNGNKHIDKVTINGNVFTDYSAFSFVWEKSYIKEPVRSGSGAIGNLNSYSTFLTPHLKIDFGLMSIASYRKIMQLIYSGNEFLVTCYDVVNNKDTTNKMYFSTEEMPKLWTIVDALNGDENAIMLLGVQDYTVEMIGTNEEVDTITVNYYMVSPDIPKDEVQSTDYELLGSASYNVGEDFIVGQSISVTEVPNYTFSQQWALNSLDGTLIDQNSVFTVGKQYEQQDPINPNTNSINFYAKYEKTGLILVLNYGLGETIYDQQDKPITSLRFNTAETIGTIILNANKKYREPSTGIAHELTTLPQSPDIYVKRENFNDDEYPYINDGWFTTNIKVANSVALTNSSAIQSTASTTIYQIFTPKKYTVTFQSNGGTAFNKLEGEMAVPYKSQVALPTPYKHGYTFKGWYLDSSFTKQFNGTMPPRNITLYAKWE